jgi:hypothetical protein
MPTALECCWVEEGKKGGVPKSSVRTNPLVQGEGWNQGRLIPEQAEPGTVFPLGTAVAHLACWYPGPLQAEVGGLRNGNAHPSMRCSVHASRYFFFFALLCWAKPL